MMAFDTTIWALEAKGEHGDELVAHQTTATYGGAVADTRCGMQARRFVLVGWNRDGFDGLKRSLADQRISECGKCSEARR